MSDIQAFYKATKIVEPDQRSLGEHGIHSFESLMANKRDVWKKDGAIGNVCDDTFTLLCGLIEYLKDYENFDEESFVTFLILHRSEKESDEPDSFSDEDDEFQLQSQGFDPSSTDSLENDEDENEVDGESEGLDGQDFGVRFKRRICYHYRTREGLNKVAIRSFSADQTIAHCVLVLRVTKTFLGQHGVTELYPNRYKYVQVWKKLSPVCLSKLRDSCAEPRSMPPLCCGPQQKGGRQSFSYFFENNGSNRVGHRGEKRVVELFCDAGGMHQGYKDNGFITESAIDKDDDAVETFRHNNPESANAVESIDVHTYIKVYKVKGDKQVHVLHASSPCQGFSRANRLGGKDDDKNNELAFTFTKGLKKFKPLVGVFENVEGMWSRKASSYGDPQKRPRIIIFATQRFIPLPPVPERTHVRPEQLAGGVVVNSNRKLPWVTVGNVLEGLCHPSLRFPNMEPRKTSNTAVGVNGVMQVGKDELAPAIRASGPPIFHYRSIDGSDKLPCLSVREMAAIQSFPNDYEFLGSLSSQYRQVGNSVPCGLARAMAHAVSQVLLFVYAEELPRWLAENRKVIEVDDNNDDDDEEEDDSEPFKGVEDQEEPSQPESSTIEINSSSSSSSSSTDDDNENVAMESGGMPVAAPTAADHTHTHTPPLRRTTRERRAAARPLDLVSCGQGMHRERSLLFGILLRMGKSL
eukprot:scaffold6061_cov156-Amphora_coffeaeformis.AAC.7